MNKSSHSGYCIFAIFTIKNLAQFSSNPNSYNSPKHHNHRLNLMVLLEFLYSLTKTMTIDNKIKNGFLYTLILQHHFRDFSFQQLISFRGF